MPLDSFSCFFVSDLHGNIGQYRRLLTVVAERRPRAVFLGGDILPSGLSALLAPGFAHEDFLRWFLAPELESLRDRLGEAYPRIFVILGNDDGRGEERIIEQMAESGLWEHVHNRSVGFAGRRVFGYAYIPPTPFLLKDWERYDVSRFVDVGCVAPEDGVHSLPVSKDEVLHTTIEKDLKVLTNGCDLERAIFLFHSPPYQTKLDRAALDGKMVDGVEFDLHIGSIAVRRFIEQRQPYLTLHGHVHESARLTGSWRDLIGRTPIFSAAHDGLELALISFDPDDPSTARRELLD